MQETIYCKLFNETKRPTKPVEYQLIGQNCMASTCTYILEDMTQKQMDKVLGYDTKTRWTVEHKSKEWSPF